MSKDIETMINEAPVLTLDPFSTTELPAESSQAVPAEMKEESLTESIPEACLLYTSRRKTRRSPGRNARRRPLIIWIRRRGRARS